MAYNIRKRRTELGLTLADVANAVGVSKGTVSKWESGKTQNMRADNAYNLANILGVSVIEILSGEEMQKIQGKAFSPQADPPSGAPYRGGGGSYREAAPSGTYQRRRTLDAVDSDIIDSCDLMSRVLSGEITSQEVSSFADSSAGGRPLKSGVVFDDITHSGNALQMDFCSSSSPTVPKGDRLRRREAPESGQAAPHKSSKGARQSPNVQPLIFKDCVCEYRSKKPHINQDLFKGTNAGIYNPTGKPLSKDSLFANSDYSWQIEALNMSGGDINPDEMRDSTAAVYGGSEASPKDSGDYATLMLLKDGCEPIIVKLSENGFSQIVSTINAIKHNGSK